MKVFEKINDYINKNGLNQSEIAKKSGIEANKLRDILNGKRIMDSSDLRAICLTMNVKPEKFM